MDNRTITDIFNQIHNVWWRKWRDKDLNRHDPEWEMVVSEARDILDEYYHPLVVHMIQDLLDELERRTIGKESKESA